MTVIRISALHVKDYTKFQMHCKSIIAYIFRQ